MNGRTPFTVLLQWMIDRGGCAEGMAYSRERWSGMTLDQTFADLAKVGRHPDFDPAWARWVLKSMLDGGIRMRRAWKAALLTHMLKMRPDRCFKHYLGMHGRLASAERLRARDTLQTKINRPWPA